MMPSTGSDDAAGEDWPQAADQWPNLFRETSTMTVGSVMVFALADLRRLAREGLLGEAVLNLPISGRAIRTIWNESKEDIKRRIRSDEYNTVEYIMRMCAEVRQYELELEGTEVHFVGDDNASQECVYAIKTNSQRRQILVAFRGSITLNDWFQDAKSAFGDIPNPLRDMDRADDGQPETLALHLGFRYYLYGDSQSTLPAQLRKLGKEIAEEMPKVPVPFPKEEEEEEEEEHSAGSNDEPTTKAKIDIILDQIRSLYEKLPDYRLYITGHSLGGALALITALEAAAKVRREGRAPVTCITVGNPKAGSLSFRSAVQTLERERTLRVLAVHRVDDVVPLLPDRLLTFSLSKSFCHVGMQLRLWGDRGTHEIRYHGNREDKLLTELREKAWHAWLILPCLHRIKERHFYRSYLEALAARREELEKLNLNDFYDYELGRES